MNKFCTLQTETSCSNRLLTHPTAIIEISACLDTKGIVESTDFIDIVALLGWLAASTNIAIVSLMLTEGLPLARE